MAQEKELLKESINDLQNVVSGLENDNAALSSTLQLVSASNQQFRQSVIVGLLTGMATIYSFKNILEFKDICFAIQTTTRPWNKRWNLKNFI